MRAVAPDTAVSGLTLMDQLMLDTLWQQRLWGFLLAGFAGLALLLAAVGLYGVIGYLVKQRQFEFGIRIALGASRRRILANVTGEGLRLVLVGLVVGAVLSVMLTSTISALLVSVTAHDPMIFVSVPLLVILVGVAATLVPAYRAMATEPTDALRAQ
jgi:ABC-type antimicrobial peptide transport system permease subunit